MKKLLFILFFISSSTFAWNGANSPRIFANDLIYRFHELKLEASLDKPHSMWPGFYWPHNKGSIAYRWSGDGGVASKKLYSKVELLSMSEQKLNELSPIEKLDILNADYNYTETKRVLRLANQNAKDWNGLCHGFAAASLNHEEKGFQKLKSSDGIELSLFTSDIKALLSYYYAKNESQGVKQIGKRCFFSSSTPILWRYKACSDVNAASFHIILTNYIGIKNKGFIADLDRFKEVWNYPIYGYKSEIISQSSSKIHLKTSMYHVPIVYPHYAPLIGTSFDDKKEVNFEYVLNINIEGEITGGYWKSWQRPDFLWIQDKLNFENNFKILDDILSKHK